MGHVFDLKTGILAVGDPTMGLARCSLALPAGSYQLGSRAFQRVAGQADVALPPIVLDSPCVYAMDASHVTEFESWYHRVGNECAYMALTLAARLPEFETAVGARVCFYWEQEVASENREGQYVLDPARVLKHAEPATEADGGAMLASPDV